MPLLAIGINHNTASVELREKIAFGPDKLSEALKQLAQGGLVKGSVIVSTCNRSEIYCELPQVNQPLLINWLAQFHQVEEDLLRPSLYLYEDQQAVRHLMRVACGLDSLVLGEPQILGQVKQAYWQSREAKAMTASLEKWFQKAFSVAKRVRTETEIGSNAVSVAYAACHLAKHIFESITDANVLLVGAGETIELVAKHLAANHCRSITVANRTQERAQRLADEFNGHAITLPEIATHLAQADIVISSTASPLPIIGKGLVESALKARRYQPMLLIDIAVPRDIEAQVADLDGAYLYTVDDLHNIVENNLAQRKQEAVQAEAIIFQECNEFITQIRALNAVESIKDYRYNAHQMREALLKKSLQALALGGDPEQLLNELSYKLTNKLIHAPTRALQQAAEQEDPVALAKVKRALGLEHRH